ncbi:MAG TPA: UDP-N-acetylmuramate dehydrogenase [Verrucomicrobia bacterium]|nr:UDP-N-acetylmuramate dehydrogenase [Verrucomicrobiota bacterium]HOB32579.1 UDP-N-acetylmuramate dehydrogenase [Verrucomicrobiota bacterium]HOP97240.1 UDP-N-acetylmuramate dehydrogenase [Verrucomicrobiota bacterium]HPU55164.1 UDP-N-acetylmuramate dehydrogenase [Verrucomicrobiota bacterium]
MTRIDTMAPVHSAGPCADELRRRVSSETLVRRDEPMSRRTTLRVGGPADVYVEPASERDLAEVIRFCAARAVRFLVLGRGSNLLVRDGGFRGVVISLAHPHFSGIELDGNRLRCGAGARLKDVAIAARRHGLSGLEFLEGIPGSVGGALRMNAGAMNSATFDIVAAVRVMDYAAEIREMAPSAMEVTYRRCGVLERMIALAAVFEGRPDSQEAIAQRMLAFSRKRWASQPAAPSAGCIFKNPITVPAGRLIDELGCKGLRVGAAVVSQEHGNFIVNEGGATARDVLKLIELLREQALARRGIDLETEVEIVGED